MTVPSASPSIAASPAIQRCRLWREVLTLTALTEGNCGDLPGAYLLNEGCRTRGCHSNDVKTLLILRHAKSSWDDSALDDHERPLNSRGKRDAPRIARLAHDEGLIPELILSSDAVRAHLTAEAMADATGAELLLDARLYHATVADILALIPTVVRDEAATVMIVGHNPGLEELVALLTGEW